MLPGLRFVIGAVFATAMLAVVSVGLFKTVKLEPQSKTGPLQTSRSLGFHERADWNQFYDPEALRRFEELAGKSDAADLAAKRSAEEQAPAVAEAPAEAAPGETGAAAQPAAIAEREPQAADQVTSAEPLASESGVPAAEMPSRTSPGEAASETPVMAPSPESPSESTAALAPAPAADNTPLWQDEPLFIVDETIEAASAADHSATPTAADHGAEKPPRTEAP
jgi:hypothetical protein